MLDGPGSMIINGENQPLFILNDRIVSDVFLRRLKQEYIDSISVIKGDDAIQGFGSDGKNGVVKIYGANEILIDLKPDTSR